MQAFSALLQSQPAATLPEALLHSLWQALLIGVLLYAGLRMVPAGRAAARYNAAVGSLGAVLVAFLTTWAVLNYEPSSDATPTQTAIETLSQAETESVQDVGLSVSSPADVRTIPPAAARFVPLDWEGPVAVGWLIGVCVMLMRAVWLAHGAGRLRRCSRPVTDPRILGVVENLRGRMRIARRITVLACERVVVPGVIGCLRPALLVPVSMLSEIPADDLYAVLAHELAHIRRHDYLVNFCQLIVEALFFFNPAAWWVSRQVRIEREACCDRAGVAACGTGRRYAEVLALWAARLSPAGPSMPAAAIVRFGGSDLSGSIIDRIKRVLTRDHRPRLRVSWPIAGVMLVASIAVLFALYKGTNATVALAGKLLSPQERIDRLNEIARTHGVEAREYGPADKILLSGTVATWDGRPLPKDTHIVVHSRRPRHSGSYGVSLSQNGPFTYAGTFEYEAVFGEIRIAVSADGYAPAFSGPHRSEPGGMVTGIEITLQAGFDAAIRLVDEQKNPIGGAEIIGGYLYDEGSYSHSIGLTTDESGVAVLKNAAAQRVALQVRADGFEFDRSIRFTPDPERPAVFALKPTVPAMGTVIAKDTGQPVQGAEIRLMLSKAGDGSYSEGGMHGEAPAVTDTQGRFALRSLRADTQYLVLVKADGYMPTYSDTVAPGRGVELALDRFRPIQGKVIGDLGRLKLRDGRAVVSYTDTFVMTGHSSVGSAKTVECDIRDGEALFSIDDYWGQTVSITAADESRTLDPATDDIDNVIFNLSPETDSAKRCVVLQVNVPEGSPPAAGGLRIDHITDEMRRLKRGMAPQWLELKDGTAEVYLPVPCDFKYSIDYYHGPRPIGYWFAEMVQPVRIEPDDEPFVVRIEAHPAGGIYGVVRNADGSPCEQASASLVPGSKPSIVEYHHSLSNVLSGTDRGKYNAAPLPLDGAYIIVAHRGDTWVATDPIALTAANPIQPCDVPIPEGITLQGRLLGPDGSPARMMVRLEVSLKTDATRWGSGGREIRPDEMGRFAFENVNRDFKGDYYIKVTTEPGYRPLRHNVADPTKPVVLELAKGLSVTGVVLDSATGRPVPNAQLWAWADSTSTRIADYESLEADGPADGRGRFTFSNMANRRYRLNVRNANMADSMRPVEVIGGQIEPATIRINIPQWSELKPAAPEP